MLPSNVVFTSDGASLNHHCSEILITLLSKTTRISCGVPWWAFRLLAQSSLGIYITWLWLFILQTMPMSPVPSALLAPATPTPGLLTPVPSTPTPLTPVDCDDAGHGSKAKCRCRCRHAVLGRRRPRAQLERPGITEFSRFLLFCCSSSWIICREDRLDDQDLC